MADALHQAAITGKGEDVVAEELLAEPGAQVVLGDATQLESRLGVPVVHTVELLDWATGGTMPLRLAAIAT